MRLLLVGLGVGLGASCGTFHSAADAPPPVSAVDRNACAQVWLWRLPEGNYLEMQTPKPRDAATLGTQARINLAALALASACLRTGTIPAELEDLPRTPLNQPREPCTVEEALLVDWWGRALLVGGAPSRLSVMSSGPDGVHGTGDDIGLPDSTNAHGVRVNVKTACPKR